MHEFSSLPGRGLWWTLCLVYMINKVVACVHKSLFASVFVARHSALWHKQGVWIYSD
jgi:hypothetical protein